MVHSDTCLAVVAALEAPCSTDLLDVGLVVVAAARIPAGFGQHHMEAYPVLATAEGVGQIAVQKTAAVA